MDERLEKYRADLVDTLRFLNEAYDKMLVTLAGGALALSMVFLSDVASIENTSREGWLVFGWIAFVVSLACVLGRILSGIEAYRHAIRQVDEGTIDEQQGKSPPARISRTLHVASAVSLIAGFLGIAVFIYHNVGG